MAYTSSKKRLHGRVTVLLTIAVLVIAVLSNTIVTTLAMRYGWFVNMNPPTLFNVSDICYQFLDTYVIDEIKDSDQKIEIIFCDEKDNILASDVMSFVHDTAEELQTAYSDNVTISYINVFERPKLARSYGVTSSSAVVIKYQDNHRVCNLQDFFLFSVKDTSTPVAYNGEKRFAIAMKAVTSADDAPMCYFTLNHGETFPDYSMLFAATDAGYMVNYLDALSFDIPEDCDLLVTYNPAQDFAVADGVSQISEINKLDAYMQSGGKYVVFVSADTFAAGGFKNLESYLATWGVTFDHKPNSAGVEECYAIRDVEHSLTTDGYTIVGKIPASGTTGGDVMKNISGTVRLSNATSISIAKDFEKNDRGDYVNGEYTLTPLLTSYASAEAWAGGRAAKRASDGFNLVTLTRHSSGAALFACTSTEFASEATMQSSVYKNEDFFLTALGEMGKTDTPIALSAQPFSDDAIRTLTTANATRLTLALTIIPTTLVLATGLIILIRRKFA